MFKRILLILLVFLLLFAGYLFIGTPPLAKEITWGVNFSQKHARDLGLDWKTTYLALLDDLGVKHLKVAAHWDLIEPGKDKFYFDDIDWQIKEAENHNAKILLVIGMKTGRWPECHIPEWAKNLNKAEQQEMISKLIEKIVLRYRDRVSVNMWQVENEPFFPFGECPWTDRIFLRKEINLVKTLDPNHQVVISDSGEGSFWIRAAQEGDTVGTTMYEKVWVSFSWEKTKMPFLPKTLKEFGFYLRYPFPSTFYWRKAQIIKKLFNKEVICIELQAEPWCPTLLYDCPLEEQKKTMDIGQFQKNIEFAKKTGLKEFYLWGGEWWYWMKEKQNQSEIWQEAKKLLAP